MPYTTDHQRIEATIPARLVYSVIMAGVQAERDKETAELPEEMKVFLAGAEEGTMEPIRTGIPKFTAKLARRVERTCVPVINDLIKQEMTTVKMTLVCYHLVRALTDSGVLILYEDSVFAVTMLTLMKAMERIAHEEFNNPLVDKSARKQARAVLRRLREDGYYRYPEIDEHLS